MTIEAPFRAKREAGRALLVPYITGGLGAWRETIEEIAAAVKKKDVSLDKSIELLEEGVRLAARCQAKLEEFDQRILEVSRNADGTASVAPFAHDPTHPD